MFSINKFRNWRKPFWRRGTSYVPPTVAAVIEPPLSSASAPTPKSRGLIVSVPLERHTTPEDFVQDGSDGPLGESKVDILFLQDTTASQGPYFLSAKAAIQNICNKVVTRSRISSTSTRFGLIAFRDHSPQDYTFITKNFGFSSNIGVMKKNLASLKARGGGGGPEAVTAALASALEMPWGEKAMKVVVLITDAPPHGIGEANDAFDCSPDQNDPLDIARQMAEREITLFVLACEPTLSTQYKNAVDFYAALTEITSGKMLPLTVASKLGVYIAAIAEETIETEVLIKEYKDQIAYHVFKDKTPEEAMQEMQDGSKKRKAKLCRMHLEDVYHESEQSTSNKNIWKGSDSIQDARNNVSEIMGPRIKPPFANSMYASGLKQGRF